LKNTNSKKE